ncbi:MAG TPA: glutaredoxin family protein, partial [Burkholderiales bacterium]|nr:glutaredoxin family protein [Burkholderiales bacterium]
KALAALLALGLAAASVSAQQLYRWTDEKGRVHVTDTPPPASAREVQKKALPPSSGGQGQVPYELAVAMKEFPVVLYTAPSCKDACERARAALNRRGVPFREVQVWNPETGAELRKVAGRAEVPTLVVGRSVQSGFEQGAYDALLDSARYPKAGILPARSQAAPPPPEGYVAANATGSKAASKPKPAAEPEMPKGPYAPGAPPQRATQRPEKK